MSGASTAYCRSTTSGGTGRSPGGRGLAARAATMSLESDFAGERLLDRAERCAAAPQLVLVVIEGARHADGVERQAVGGREHLRVDDIGAGGGAGAGDDRQQTGMVGRDDGEFGDAAEGVGDDYPSPSERISTALACRSMACWICCGRSTLSQ